MTISVRRLMREEEPEWIVWALVLVMLVGGVLLKNSVVGRTESFSGNGVAFNYPEAWVQQSEANELFRAVDPFSSAQFPTGVAVRQIPAGEVGRNLSSLSDIALAWSTRQGRDLQAYRSLNIEPRAINGREALVIDYAYIPQAVMGGSRGSLPVVARAQDFLIQQGDTLSIITLAAEATVFETEAATWEAILSTLSVR